MKDLVRFVAENLVERPERVSVREVTGDKSSVIEIEVAPEDRGKLIGKEGRTIRSLRTLVQAAASRSERRVSVEVLD
jgi:predicted RNA-binding protein YlqC (UPF0109 family)